MAWIAGADGCKAGWFRILRESGTGELRSGAVVSVEDLLREEPRPSLVAIDIPIGLTDAGPRACDREARKLLGWPRRTSVFPAPIRPALVAEGRQQASLITAAADGRKVGTQAWALYSKIGEVDDLLQRAGEARDCLREVHPEVCFWAWSGGRAMAHGKKSGAGRAERLRLLSAWLGESALADARNGYLKKEVADDDILDAFAALWTATRITEGCARRLPNDPLTDSTGLPMEIVY